MPIDPARVKEIRAGKQTIVLSPTLWAKCTISEEIVWYSVKFTKDNRQHIPRKRGIYAFVVRHENSAFPPHGYIFYIGIAGKRGNKNTLRDRYPNYFNDPRPRVEQMIKEFEGNLTFYFAPIDNEETDIEYIEKELNSAILPPANKNDLHADVKSDREAAF